MARKSRVIRRNNRRSNNRRSNNRRSNNRLRKTKRKKLMGGRVNDDDKDTRGYAYVDRVPMVDKDNYYTEEIVYCFDKIQELKDTWLTTIKDSTPEGGKNLLTKLIDELYEYIEMIKNSAERKRDGKKTTSGIGDWYL